MVASGSRGDLGDLLPRHAELVADGGAVDAVAGTEIAHRVAQFVLALKAAQPPIDVLEQLVLFFRRVAVVAAILAIHDQREPADARDRRLKGQPPQFAGAVGKAGRDVDRERRLVFPQDRHCVTGVVAIAVVEREAYEAAAEILFLEAAMRLVERNNVDVRAAQFADHVFEELRRNLEQAVRLERLRARRAHVMQGQDCANTADERAQHPVCAREIERFHSGSQNELLQAGQDTIRTLRCNASDAFGVKRRRRAPEQGDIAEARVCEVVASRVCGFLGDIPGNQHAT